MRLLMLMPQASVAVMNSCPAGTLLLLTVLAFNLVGDGLRDAFDPKMKR